MVVTKIYQMIMVVLVVLVLSIGLYAGKTYLKASTLRSEVATLTSALDKSRKAVVELTETVSVLENNNSKLDSSIKIYITQLEEDNTSITNLRRKLANVENKETNECFNRVVVPDSILNELYTKD